MKAITAVIKPFKLDDVKEALSELGIQGFTVTEAKGFGSRRGHTELYKGAEYVVDFLPKIIVFVTVSDDQAKVLVPAILKAACTGKVGDGRVTVVQAEEFWNIRTSEKITEEIGAE